MNNIKHKCGTIWPLLTQDQQSWLNQYNKPEPIEGAIYALVYAEKLLHQITKRKSFEGVPDFLLTDEQLLNKDATERNIFIKAAEDGYLDAIPTKLFTVPRTLAQDSNGRNLLIVAVVAGQLAYVPTKCITFEGVVSQDKYSDNALTEAARYGCVNQIPDDIVIQAVEYCNSNGLSNSDGRDTLQTAARYGHLDQIPSKCFYSAACDCILWSDKSTWMHVAAYTGALSCVPRDALTDGALRIQNASGNSVVQIAVAENQRDQLLGVRLGAEFRKELGEAWWDKNTSLIKEKEDLLASLVRDSENDIEIF